MSRFFDERLSELAPYVPGEQPRGREYIKLNTNESPFPPSPAVLAAINSEAVSDLRLYSDPECFALKQAIADEYVLRNSNIFVGNGSDEVLNFLFMAYGARGVAYPAISYGFYKVFAALYRLEKREIPLMEDFTINPADYCSGGYMKVIANPNAPTGILLTLPEIEEILSKNPDAPVVIDEAYIDFGGDSALALLPKYPNLVIVRTYSKSRSLAGARLGYAIAGKEIIADLERIKFSTNPYNINRLTLIAGKAAMEDGDYFEKTRHEIIQVREYVTDELRKRGYKVLDSAANFIFAKSPKVQGGRLYRELKELGILVRHFDDERIMEYNRITIGKKEDMDALLAAIDKIERD